MKKRILFVDDEALILLGLRRQLYNMRNEWDMDFVESGSEALALMEKASYDVVVTDMQMPGMNGAELLNEVMKRHPLTIRLILSGHADQNLLAKCINATHQCLSKPCPPDILRATITRATALSLSLQDSPIRRLVNQLDRVPSLPQLYVDVVNALSTPDVALEEVGSIIARDIGMTAKILKLANSAFFGLPQEFVTPQEAVAYLGQETIKALVLSMQVFSQFDAVKLHGFCLNGLWRHSLATAATARKIAHAMHADAKLADEAFVAGVLHDTGWLVCATNLGNQSLETIQLARDKQIRLNEAEQEVFNVTHAEVGGYLLGLWGLPLPVVEAVALHHAPGRSTNKAFCPLTAVHVADALVQRAGAFYEGVPSPSPDLEYLQSLSLAGRLDDWRKIISATARSEDERNEPQDLMCR